LARQIQESLFPTVASVSQTPVDTSSTFVNNMTLPVHRWFRYSAGFSAAWVNSVISSNAREDPVHVFDPFAGSATTLIAAEQAGVESWGIDAHPFVSRVAKAKLAWRTDPSAYLKKIHQIREKGRLFRFCVSGDNQPFSLERTTRLCHRLDLSCSTSCSKTTRSLMPRGILTRPSVQTSSTT
jgi:hypothetical protein